MTRRTAIHLAAVAVGVCLLAGAWVKTLRDSYRIGAADAARPAYAAGRAEGIKLEAAALKRCMPWASWGKQRVVICQETK